MLSVMVGLDPAISHRTNDRDARVEPAHDAEHISCTPLQRDVA
jgi:hypothetical protein